jgi:hypothetical protein
MTDFIVPPVNRWCELKADAEEYLRAEFAKVITYHVDISSLFIIHNFVGTRAANRRH